MNRDMKPTPVKKKFLGTPLLLAMFVLTCSLFSPFFTMAQGMHYSQYYNAPLLVNPANTALLPDEDFRIGCNYRNQFGNIPVPYKTMALYADFQVFRNKFETNWLGVGLALFNDKAGVGNLSLTKGEAFLAYHVIMGEYAMLSVGASSGYGTRSVDMSRFTYDVQWDGFTFNPQNNSQEIGGVQKTNYWDVGAGLNLAFFPNENIYLKIGGGLAHINQPVETFLNSQNQMGIRPSVNIDALLKLGDYVIVNPSAYYTQQKNARQIIAGTMLSYSLSNTEENAKLYLGGFYRVNEAAVGVFGFGFNSMSIMMSYDFTTSSLAQYNKSQGAFEFGLKYQGLYEQGGRGRQTYNCPRF